MPRYVLLRHECPPPFQKPSHWDLMLEQNGVLRTWQLQELPGPWLELLSNGGKADLAVAARALPDHRLAYLDYEGAVSGDRGAVRQCDKGSYEVLQLADSLLEADLSGGLLCGRIRLVGDDDDWTLTTLNV